MKTLELTFEDKLELIKLIDKEYLACFDLWVSLEDNSIQKKIKTRRMGELDELRKRVEKSI